MKKPTNPAPRGWRHASAALLRCGGEPVSRRQRKALARMKRAEIARMGRALPSELRMTTAWRVRGNATPTPRA